MCKKSEVEDETRQIGGKEERQTLRKLRDDLLKHARPLSGGLSLVSLILKLE